MVFRRDQVCNSDGFEYNEELVCTPTGLDIVAGVVDQDKELSDTIIIGDVHGGSRSASSPVLMDKANDALGGASGSSHVLDGFESSCLPMQADQVRNEPVDEPVLERDIHGKVKLLVREDGLLVHPLLKDTQPCPPTLLGLRDIPLDKPLLATELEELWYAQGIDPNEFKFQVPLNADCGPSAIMGETMVYWAYFVACLTLPMDCFLEEMVMELGTILDLLHPSVVQLICAFATLSRLLGREPSPKLLSRFYMRVMIDGVIHLQLRACKMFLHLS